MPDVVKIGKKAERNFRNNSDKASKQKGGCILPGIYRL